MHVKLKIVANRMGHHNVLYCSEQVLTKSVRVLFKPIITVGDRVYVKKILDLVI
jgi:hypothetical protein